MLHRIRTLMWKEFLEMRRDPRLFGLIIVAPVLQLTVLAYAATTDVKHVPIVMVDGDRSQASRQLVGQFAGSSYFTIVDDAVSPADVDDDLAAGRAWLAVVIPAGFDAALAGHGDARQRQVQILADGSDANSSGLALAYASGVVGQFNQTRAAEAGVTALPLDAF